ncbi:Rrf2 family transcriptional regulator [Cetobacterium sp.]|uniref:Rrf2 family transcriptional regulator n=1 Tax=Cetobacterium sp. TaxID=2071632 RepID=UPI003F405502
MFSKKMEYGYIILKKLETTSREKTKLGKEILEDTKVPHSMGLSILTELSNAGLIISTKGKNGGFFLAKEKIYFLDLFVALETNQKNKSILQNKVKEDEEYDRKVKRIGKILLDALGRVQI